MTELQRRALARLPMTVEEVEAVYTRLVPLKQDVRDIGPLCESHERLRAELEGTAPLLADAEREIERLRAEWRQAQNKATRYAQCLRYIADYDPDTAAEHARRTLDGGEK